MTASTRRRRQPSGAARAAVQARIATIRDELRQGWTVKTIYDRHLAPLDVVSYRQFARYVRAMGGHLPPQAPVRPIIPPAADDRAGSRQHSRPEARISLQPGAKHDADQRPETTGPVLGKTDRTFVHDPRERHGDYERLFGTPRKK